MMAWKNAGSEVEGLDLERNARVVKVNIPEEWSSYQSGNGEGMWAFIRHEADVPKYEKGEGEFELILLNTSIYWPQLKWGTVILAEGRGGHRPVIAKAQFQALVEEREAYFREHPERSQEREGG